MEELQDNTTTQYARRPHREPMSQDEPKNLKLRNWLNTIFIIGAIVGMIVYFYANTTVGGIIIGVAMVFKVVECCFRFIH